MIESLEKKLDFTKTLKENTNNIIEIFVLYYGEKNKKVIEEKIKNTDFVCYYPITSMIENKKIAEVEMGEILRNSFINYVANNSLEADNFKTVISEYFFKNNENYKEHLIKYLKETPSKLDRLSAFYTIDNEFSNFKEKYKWIEEYQKKEEKLKKEIEFKKWKEYIYNFKNIIPAKELDIIENIKTLDELPHFKIPITEYFFGVGFEDFYSMPNVSMFLKQYDKNLEKDSCFEKDIVKELRISNFKKLGFDFGDNYDAYIENKKCQEYILSQENIEFLLKTKETYKYEYRMEYIKTSKTGKILGQYLPYEYWKAYTCNELFNNLEKGKLKENGSILFSTKKERNKYDIYPVISLNLGIEEIDAELIRKLNHRIETNKNRVEENKVHFSSGWQKGISFKYDDELENKYKWFNKIINELITKELVKLLRSNSIYIFDYPKKTSSSKEDFYENGYELVKDFFEIYKNEILESRLNGNINLLNITVEKENFEKLNDLVNKCFETAIRQEDIKTTEIWSAMLKEKNIILEQMKLYKNERK